MAGIHLPTLQTAQQQVYALAARCCERKAQLQLRPKLPVKVLRKAMQALVARNCGDQRQRSE